MSDLLFKYINSDFKLKIYTDESIDDQNYNDYFEYFSLKESKLVIEKTDGGYLLYPLYQYKVDNLYYFKLLCDSIKVEDNKKVILLKIKKEENKELPSYYKSYLDEKIKEIKNKMSDYDYSFIFFTDVHVNNNNMLSPLILKYLKENGINIDIYFGGDIISDYTKRIITYDELVRWKEDADRIDIIYVYGNHDANSKEYNEKTEVIPMDHYKELILKNSKIDYIENTMYTSFEKRGIKVIILDTGVNRISEFDEKEALFLESEIKKEDKNILIFGHKIIEGTEKREKHPRIYLTKTGEKVEKIIDKVNINKNIIALISGHNHIDCNLASKTNVPFIATTCDASYESCLFDANFTERDNNSIEAQALDVFFINTKMRKIDTIRIGCGDKIMDRSFKY